MGKEGLEPSRLAAHDPKSCLSANSSTSPRAGIISERGEDVNKSDIIALAFYHNVNNPQREFNFGKNYQIW
jgi:hypothetical protein